MNQTVCSATSSSRILVQGHLFGSQSPIPLSVFIDSGADENLIDSVFCAKAQLPLEPLPAPREVLALDGRLLARVTHRTLPVHLQLSGNHHKRVSLYVIPSPTSPIVLGIPWLKLHNPHIDWATSSIASWSVFCHSHCLRSAMPPGKPFSASLSASPIDLTNVPSVYHDLQEVFSKDRALSLPPHRPYDCAINLLSGASLPSSKLYNLSRPEREAMEVYISESLANGLIRPSSSSVGSGFFFVEKKDKSLRPCVDYRGINDITIKGDILCKTHFFVAFICIFAYPECLPTP